MSYDRWLELPYTSQKGTDECWPECPAHIDNDNQDADCECAELDAAAKESASLQMWELGRE